jgi:hypothetical protein
VKFRRLAALALGVLVLVFVAAGCGGGDSNSEAAGTTDTVTTEDTTASDTTASDTTAADTTATEDTTSGSTDTNVDLGNLSGDCLQFAGIGAKIAQAMGGASGQNADIEKTAALFDELVANAPDEIKDDLQVLSDGIGKMAEAFKGVDFSSGATPDADQLAKIQEVMGSLDSAKLQAASKNIEAWAQANCTK